MAGGGGALSVGIYRRRPKVRLQSLSRLGPKLLSGLMFGGCAVQAISRVSLQI